MWCFYCRKSDHDDAHCWCTRAVVTPPPPFWTPPTGESPPFAPKVNPAVLQALLQALARASK